MQSLREFYRIGNGPSSSHTIGPRRAAELFLAKHPLSARLQVTLFGSLAATGKGHLTDKAIQQAFPGLPVEFIWKPEIELPLHPNGMVFEAFDETGRSLGTWEVYSPGGGAIMDGSEPLQAGTIYHETSLEQIMAYCSQNGLAFWEYIKEKEGPAIWEFLQEIWQAMTAAIERGIQREGVLPGGLGVARKSRMFYLKTFMSSADILQQSYLSTYALAVAEENASGGVIVTAPSSGASGVVPAVLCYMQENLPVTEDTLLHALATAGLIGNLAKSNASISGAEVGCQGEIGTACAMAAAAAAQLLGGTIYQVEYAAEMGLEHHLGLTCDPVGDLVQIPCIERNVFAATRALSCAFYALFSDGQHIISYDKVLQVMKQTGHDLPHPYRETSSGGLALAHRPANGSSTQS